MRPLWSRRNTPFGAGACDNYMAVILPARTPSPERLREAERRPSASVGGLPSTFFSPKRGHVRRRARCFFRVDDYRGCGMGRTSGQADQGPRCHRQLVVRGEPIQVLLVRADPCPERKGAEHAPVPHHERGENLGPPASGQCDRPSAVGHHPGLGRDPRGTHGLPEREQGPQPPRDPTAPALRRHIAIQPSPQPADGGAKRTLRQLPELSPAQARMVGGRRERGVRLLAPGDESRLHEQPSAPPQPAWPRSRRAPKSSRIISRT